MQEVVKKAWEKALVSILAGLIIALAGMAWAVVTAASPSEFARLMLAVLFGALAETLVTLRWLRESARDKDAAATAQEACTAAQAAKRVAESEAARAIAAAQVVEREVNNLALHGGGVSVRAFCGTLEANRVSIALRVWQLLPVRVEVREFTLRGVALAEVPLVKELPESENDRRRWRAFDKQGGPGPITFDFLLPQGLTLDPRWTRGGALSLTADSFSAEVRLAGADASSGHMSFSTTDARAALQGVCYCPPVDEAVPAPAASPKPRERKAGRKAQ